MTLLTLVQDCADEIGLPRPSAVISSTDQTVRTLLRMANREGESLVMSGDWVELQRLHTLTTVSGTDEYSLPTDYERLIVDTEWDRSDLFPIWGPITPQEWQAIKSGLIGSGVSLRRYRLMRSATTTSKVILIDPTPTTSGDTLAFEYISKNWCESSGNVAQSAFAADDDTTILPEKLISLGVIVRFKRSKGFDFSSDAVEYEDYKAKHLSQNRPAKTVLMHGTGNRDRYLNWQNVPDTGFGV